MRGHPPPPPGPAASCGPLTDDRRTDPSGNGHSLGCVSAAATTAAQESLRPKNGQVMPQDAAGTPLLESFERRDKLIIRRLTLEDRQQLESLVADEVPGADGALDAHVAERHFLRARKRPPFPAARGRIQAVDLFSGCGGLSLGFSEASRALHREFVVSGLDTDPVAGEVFRANLPGSSFRAADVNEWFDGPIGSRLTRRERIAQEALGPVDILLGGPPCQGHSAFNNRTRHSDERNDLYLRMVRAAEVLEPEHVVIENVPGATRDRKRVVQRALTILERIGYRVTTSVLDAADVGVAQRRKRLLVVGSARHVDLEAVTARHRTVPRSVRWAIEDLEDIRSGDLIDEPGASVPTTRQRIDYLFDHDLFDLPNEQRPACHANGNHSYRSIYGRLSWDEAAQTLTTGFYCMCMGRYVHPSRRRTLTAREAARIQFFPDWFDFGAVEKRSDLARLIGNAVPPKLGYVVGLELLR